MRKKFLLFLFCALFLPVSAQQITEEAIVINVEVPVRVFDREKFVDHLTIDGFEVYEDGILQKIEAVYLIKKRNIERSDEKRRFVPQTARNFYLFFEISEYTVQLGKALEYFIQNVLYPGDHLTVVTPMRTYRLRPQALEVKTREQILSQLKGLLRQDTLTGNSEYRNTINQLESLARSLSAAITQSLERSLTLDISSTFTGLEEMGVDEQLHYYEELLHRLEHLRKIDQSQLLHFSRILKEREGQKYIFMFYEKEYIPQIDPKILNQYISMFQDRPDLQQTISGLIDFFRRDTYFDVESVKKSYADSSISVHFLFISRPAEQRYGVYMQEQSEDIYVPFREMARATGGFADISANPESLFQKALDASENYYLLYYIPQNYKSDGKFRNIEVRVKNASYRVLHRVGYFAN